jgi:hypothetical protein
MATTRRTVRKTGRQVARTASKTPTLPTGYLTKRKLPHKASPNSKRADWASSMARRTISGRTHFMKNAGMVWIWYPLQQGLSNPGLLRMSSLSLDRRAVPWLPKAVKSREARWFPRLV